MQNSDLNLIPRCGQYNKHEPQMQSSFTRLLSGHGQIKEENCSNLKQKKNTWYTKRKALHKLSIEFLKELRLYSLVLIIFMECKNCLQMSEGLSCGIETGVAFIAYTKLLTETVTLNTSYCGSV